MAKAHILSGLIKFVGRPEWDEVFGEFYVAHVGHVCDEFDIDPEDLDEVLDDVLGATLHGCVLEHLATVEFDDGCNLVDTYLRRRGYAESSGTRRYLQALRDSVMSLYEISDVVPGKSFLARDLFRGGEPVRVLEVSGSRTLKAWDRLGARLLPLGSEWRMAGGVLLFDRATSEQLIEVLHELGEGGDFVDAAEVLAHAAPAFTMVWLADALDRTLNPRMPTFQNTDGHPIVMCTSSFALQSGATAAACRAALSVRFAVFRRRARASSAGWAPRATARPERGPRKQARPPRSFRTGSPGKPYLGASRSRNARSCFQPTRANGPKWAR